MTDTLAFGHIHRNRGEYLAHDCQRELSFPILERELTLARPFRSYQRRSSHQR